MLVTGVFVAIGHDAQHDARHRPGRPRGQRLRAHRSRFVHERRRDSSPRATSKTTFIARP